MEIDRMLQKSILTIAFQEQVLSSGIMAAM